MWNKTEEEIERDIHEYLSSMGPDEFVSTLQQMGLIRDVHDERPEITSEEHLDGICFIKGDDIVAFYVYDLHRLEIRPDAAKRAYRHIFRGYDYIPFSIRDLKYIIAIVTEKETGKHV